MKAINYLKEVTWDFHNNRRIKTLHPAIRQQVIDFINHMQKEYYITLRVTSALWTWEEQEKLYNQPFDKIDNDKDGYIDKANE